MKKSLMAASCCVLGVALLLGAAPAVAQGQGQGQARVSLLCKGSVPVYTQWDLPPGQGTDAELLVQIDRAARTVSTTLATIGELTAPLEVSERFYLGTSPLGRVVHSRSLDGVEISVNRVTGEGRLLYLVGETSYPAFTGKCTLAPRS